MKDPERYNPFKTSELESCMKNKHAYYTKVLCFGKPILNVLFFLCTSVSACLSFNVHLDGLCQSHLFYVRF